MHAHNLLILVTTLLLAACAGQEAATPPVEPVKYGPEGYSDRMLFELKGNVKECVRDTYYDTTVLADGSIQVDTLSVRSYQSYFDELGNYVPADDELVKRDSLERLTYWRDARPSSSLHPGVLRDTLAYTYVNPWVIATGGIGEEAVAVYDAHGNIVGQFSQPLASGIETAAFNIVLEEDAAANWTRRLTVWLTQSADGRPHVSYTLDTRDILYY